MDALTYYILGEAAREDPEVAAIVAMWQQGGMDWETALIAIISKLIASKQSLYAQLYGQVMNQGQYLYRGTRQGSWMDSSNASPSSVVTYNSNGTKTA